MKIVLTAVLLLLAVTGAAQEQKVVVPGVYAYAGVPAGTAEVLTDLLLEALLARHGVRALGPSDVRAVLNAEQQKNLLGCTDQSCMAELAGAMGADWLVAGSVGRLEDLYVLSLQLIDAKLAKVTARANISLKSIKNATEQMGPLVDKLLGSKPRIRSPASVLHVPAPVTKKAMDMRAHCQLVRSYVDRVVESPYDSQLVSLRRDILEDLVVTKFLRLFKKKLTCFWPHHGATQGTLNGHLRKALTDKEAWDAKRRIREFYELTEQIKLLEEEYQRGLEMEKNGSGTRLAGIPFSVEESKVTVPEDSPEFRAFKEAYPQAQKVLGQALDAVEEGDQKAFKSFFVAPQESGYTSPDKVFDNLRKYLKQGFQFDLCPLGILFIAEIERAVSLLKRRGQLDGCWRRKRDQSSSTDRVQLIKHEGEWRIIRW